jgi:microcin C transport system substrate-binding protein
VNAPIAGPRSPATRALDRVLSWNYHVVPQWYLDRYWLAYWNRFGIPEIRRPCGIGRDSSWVDAQKDADVRRFLKR